MGEFLRKSLAFVKDLSTDPRIPKWDKAMLVAMVALLVSPVDFISDYIPILGQLDDLVIAILLLDYVINRLPEQILLDHFPWEPSRMVAWRRRLRFLSLLVPAWARDRLWAMQAEKMKAAEAGAEAGGGTSGKAQG
ncbi:MAG TPA: DUF1232 domain-containing protein [Fibrobacteria bacterium]|nr:DUF1232 domain-containing protein [Fibrobacteria bacterium]